MFLLLVYMLLFMKVCRLLMKYIRMMESIGINEMFYNIKNMFYNEKKIFYIAYAVLLVLVILAAFVLGRKSVYNNGAGADTVAGGINAAEKSIDEAQKQSDSIASGINAAEATAGRLETIQRGAEQTVSDIQQSVDRCQNILDTVSKRPKEKIK